MYMQGGKKYHIEAAIQNMVATVSGIICDGAKAGCALKKELQDYTRKLILNFGKKGLVLGGDCTIDAAIDRERIRWIVEAARSL